MIPAVSIGRYCGAYDLLSKLADWLRDQRTGRYDQLVNSGQMTADAAEQDRQARIAIARDWRAIACDRPRDWQAFAVPDAWRAASLADAIAGAERRIERRPDDDRERRDWIDLRDATATLAYYEPLPLSILLAQAIERDRRAEAA